MMKLKNKHTFLKQADFFHFHLGTNLNVHSIMCHFEHTTFDGLKFGFSKNATKIDEIFTVDLTLTTLCASHFENPTY